MMKTLVNPSSTDSRKKNVVSTKSTDKQPNAFSEYIGHCTYNSSCGSMPMFNIYPTKKKRNSRIFPLSFPFNTKMLIVIKYKVLIISRQNSSLA